MEEHVPLLDVIRLRVYCRNEDCGAIIELPLGLKDKLQEGICKYCGNEFGVWEQRRGSINSENNLLKLAEAVKFLQVAKEKVAIDFVVPEKPAAKVRPNTDATINKEKPGT